MGVYANCSAQASEAVTLLPVRIGESFVAVVGHDFDIFAGRQRHFA